MRNINLGRIKKEVRKILFITLALLSFSSELFSQANEIKFETITLEDGLSQSSVSTIIQDSKGFIWIGTLDGLNKYDGYSIKTFRHHPDDETSIADNAINTIFEDSEKNIWVGTRNGGLCKFDRYKKNFKSYQYSSEDEKSISSNNISSIIEDYEGDLWVATDKGLNKLNVTNESFEVYTTKNTNGSLLSNDVQKIITDKSGNLWIATNNGLNKLNIATEKISIYNKIFTTNKNSEKEINKSITELLFDKNNALWIGTKHGLYKLEGKAEKIISYISAKNDHQSLSSDIITSIVEDHDGMLWIGTKEGGLNRFDPTTNSFKAYMHNPTKPQSLSTNNILTIYQDKSKILWIGTYLGGINKWNRAAEDLNVFRHNPYDPNSLSSSQIRAIYQDNNEDIWIGTVAGGLNKWNVKENKFIHFEHDPTSKNTISNNHVRAILQISDNEYLIGTDAGGLNLYNSSTLKFTKFTYDETDTTSISSNRVGAILKDTKGNIWIGTFGGGLNLFNKEEGTFTHYKHSDDDKSLSNNRITSLFEDSKGQLWVGTFGGGLNLWQGKGNVFTVFKHKLKDSLSLGSNLVYSIIEDSENTIWIGTKYNLNKLNSSDFTFKRYGIETGFFNNVIMGIIDDEKGNLWISTNGGLSRFNIKTEKVHNYNVKDGLQSNEFLVGSYCKSKSGEMFFGGVNGFNAFYPSNIKMNPHQPEVVITDFAISNKSVQLDTNITEKKELFLSYKDEVFSFAFVALDFIFPEKNQYAYKLENFNKDWINNGTRNYLTFTNIPPGRYVLKIKGSNSDGIWNDKGVSIIINIAPPFWKTTWFMLLSIFSVIGIIWFYIKYRERKLTQDKVELEAKVVIRTKEILAQKDKIVLQRDEILKQKDFIEGQNNKIKDSIHYASRIQKALLPSEEKLTKYLPDNFVLFKPKDIVSGDFYWLTEKNNKIILVAADCTGHGVPGAFMSMLGISFLNEIVNRIIHDKNALKANEILNQLRIKVKTSLNQTGKRNETKDGMDLSLIIIDKSEQTIQFSGANNPLYIIKKEEVEILKADRMPIGIYVREKESFTNNVFNYKKGDVFYLFSDGYVDQFGGEKGRKFQAKRFRELIIQNYQKSMKEQHVILDNAIEEWRSTGYKQIDDILVIGLRL